MDSGENKVDSRQNVHKLLQKGRIFYKGRKKLTLPAKSIKIIRKELNFYKLKFDTKSNGKPVKSRFPVESG